MTDLPSLLHKLDQLCKKHGPATPLGSRYSALHQQIQSYQTAEGVQTHALAAFMRRNQDEIAQIKKDGDEYIPENHIPGNRTAGEG